MLLAQTYLGESLGQPKAGLRLLLEMGRDGMLLSSRCALDEASLGKDNSIS